MIGKPSSRVLRGVGWSNPARLPDNIGDWIGMACLIVLKQKVGNAVMALSARPDGVNDDPLISVNSQRETATAARQT
jgi:hypothetical protein